MYYISSDLENGDICTHHELPLLVGLGNEVSLDVLLGALLSGTQDRSEYLRDELLVSLDR